MLRLGRKRKKDKEFSHIVHGLIPAASIAPKPAVPRTPPPCSPDPSPERPRSALAAAILTSSLTGKTWAIPSARPRSFSESIQSESFTSEPIVSTALYTRERWAGDFDNQPHLPTSDHSEEDDHSEEELEEEEVEEGDEEEDREENVYQTLDRQENLSVTDEVYALPIKPKTSPVQLTKMPRSLPSLDFTEKTSIQSPEASRHSSKKKASIRKSSGSLKEDVSFDQPGKPNSSHYSQPTNNVQGEVKTSVRALLERNARAEEHRLLEERLQRLEQEFSHSQASSNRSPSAGSQAELQTLRRQAQELVDENDALKLTVHRLNVELSYYQAKFRPLSKQESSRISGLPVTGSPPPWLLDMKYLSPLLLAYEDRMNEKDTLLQTVEEEVKRLRVCVEEVIKENERLHDEIAKTGVVSQKDSHQLQQQAILVLQENQVLINQLETQHVMAKDNYSRHHSEVSKLSKQLILLEAERQHLQEDLEESKREVQKNTREVQVLQARLKDAITWDEHCSIAGKLRRQLEQEESRAKSEADKLVLRASSLQEENIRLAVEKANMAADIKRMETEIELCRQADRKAARRMSALTRQIKECVLKEEKSQHYLGAVISVAEHISQERDQLLQMASVLQRDKEKSISRILKGTVRFGKLQKEVKAHCPH
ncbi:hypothetical protein LDENG_00092680 [Lucifuga dentata]|nr:hypothetical protein LDENG_00092680 [Lucifuga dentata]